MKIHIIFYSLYGHMYQMARAAAEGAMEVDGAEVKLFQVPETLTDEMLEMMGAVESKKALADVHIATANDLVDADAVIFGIPTRFGNMCGQMREFFDTTGELWAEGKLIGKVGSVMSSSNMQHGGQETTIISSHFTLLHQGMIIVGLPGSFEGLGRIDEVTGGSFYGASTIAGPQGERMPSENELAAARFQGRHVAQITGKLFG